ncbi:hypothetical protein BKA69DRAFT_1108203 [Paraphysoderma sedebokerense]|nr:hypothetical protein BKA69DRAFT_1108203 [Paraphysoderma sedebokerense]
MIKNKTASFASYAFTATGRRRYLYLVFIVFIFIQLHGMPTHICLRTASYIPMIFPLLSIAFMKRKPFKMAKLKPRAFCPVAYRLCDIWGILNPSTYKSRER